MFNLIVADFIGSAYEGGDLKGSRLPFITKNSKFTDDSVMLAATMSVLATKHREGVDLKVLTPRDFAAAYKKWGRDYSGCGFSPQFEEWLRRDTLSPGESVGSLAPVRATPIAWVTESENEAIAIAEVSARATHNSMEAINATKAVVHAIHRLRKGETLEKVARFIECLYFLKVQYSNDEWRDLHENSGFTTHAEECAGLGLAIGMQATDIESAIRLCLYVGGDTDTIGAIAASVIEARFPSVEMQEISDRVRGSMMAGSGQAIVDAVDDFNRYFRKSA